MNIENFAKKKKNGLEIWWRGSYRQYLAWTRAAVSEKPKFTDDGRLRHDSSSARHGG